MFRRLALAALLLAPLAPLAAQENLFVHVPDSSGHVRIEVTSLFSRPSPGGYLPVRVTATNATKDKGTLHFKCTSSDGGYGNSGSEMESSFAMEAPAEGSATHDFLVPVTTLLNRGYSSDIRVTIQLSGSFGASSGTLSGGYDNDQPAILLSEPLFTPNASSLDAELASRGHTGGRYGGSATFAAKFDPRQLPEDWRAYSGYDAIALTDTDWGNISPGARNAILQWNRLGGRVIVYATAASTDLASIGVAEAGHGVRSADRSVGEFRIVAASGTTLDPNSTVDLFLNSAPTPPLNKSIANDFGNSPWPLQLSFGEQAFNYALFIVVLVAFGILVGPVNLFVFAKSGRRHRLFITTPLIALGASALLIVLILLQDGFGGRGMRAVLMEVRPDNDENSAYLSQEQISRTGVLIGGHFDVAEPSTISPLPLAPSRWTRLTTANEGGGLRYEANFEDGKLSVTGDWFQSRSEQGQLVRSIVPTRGRIESRTESGPPSFLSTFEFPLETLWYLDNSGGYWRSGQIVAGRAFTCEPATEAEFRAFVNEEAGHFAQRLQQAARRLSSRRGHFIAVTTAAPGVATFDSIAWKSTRTLVTGPVVKP